MPQQTKNAAPLDRRHFLSAAGLALGAAGAAAASKSATAGVAEQRPAEQGGYQETEHVKTYYDTARF